MLVFQKNWAHIVDRCYRANVTPKWLIEMVNEINLYLPDDWRMTRSKNNFRIQLVCESNPSLTGFGYRLDNDEILYIIDTVLTKHMFDSKDIIELGIPEDEKVTLSTKKENPDILTPNLYFFSPCPDDSETPLFARQYEKIKFDEDGNRTSNQYHRIHPLTKKGLDLYHYRWVRWRTTGDVELVDSPGNSYHGKDYWIIGKLKEANEGLYTPEGVFDKKTKRDSEESYKEYLSSLMKKYKIKPPQYSEPSDSRYEIEYKYLIPGNDANAKAALNLIKNDLDKGDFSIISIEKKEQFDTYFDDDGLNLNSAGASFRMRKRSDNIRVTLKKRLPLQKGYSEAGLYTRIEEEVVITRTQEAALRNGEPINVMPYNILSYIVPNCRKLRDVMIIKNTREIITIENEDHMKAELCFDEVLYQLKGKKDWIGPFYEIELESKGAPRDQLKNFAHYLENTLGLIPSMQSKYERGVSLLRTAKIHKGVKAVILDVDCGVDDAIALILALKSKSMDVKAVTTVSGNVHVDKVIQNVFKVFHALKLDNLPIVAKGADKPLKKELTFAEDVHGKDGLGDTTYTYPNPIKIDERPAWQLICDLANKHKKQITLITVGPLTNLALAIRNDHESVANLKEVVSMGGVFFEVGNVGPSAEFNVKADPDAAHEVVRFCRDSCMKTPINKFGETVYIPNNPKKEDYLTVVDYKDPVKTKHMVPLTFIGLDVTHKVLLRKSLLERSIAAHPKNNLLKFVRDISEKYMRFYAENEGLPGCYLHDPLTVAYVINPAFLEIKKHIINVETEGMFSSGVIYPDDRPTLNPLFRNPAEEVISIAHQVEREAFEEFLLKVLIENG